MATEKELIPDNTESEAVAEEPLNKINLTFSSEIRSKKNYSEIRSKVLNFCHFSLKFSQILPKRSVVAAANVQENWDLINEIQRTDDDMVSSEDSNGTPDASYDN